MAKQKIKRKTRVSKIEEIRLISDLQALIRQGQPLSAIHNFLCESYKITAYTTQQHWIAKARVAIAEAYQQNDNQKALETAAFYDEIKQRALKSGKLSIALRAEMAKAELFGLNKPRKTEVEFSKENPMHVIVSKGFENI